MVAHVFRHGNAEVAVELKDCVLHFAPKVLALPLVVRIDATSTADQVRRAIDDAIDEAIAAYGRDLKVALQAAMDRAEARFGAGQLT